MTPPQAEKVHLYIHVPFCHPRKCAYCAFYSVPLMSTPRPAGQVVDSMLNHLRAMSDVLHGHRLTSIYIGGGTPNALPEPLFGRLLAAVAAARDAAARGKAVEWTVELNPEHISVRTIQALVTAGVSRVSVGVQSFADEELEAIGRSGTRLRVESALELVSRAYRGRFSIDLIGGIPGQTARSLAASVAQALSYDPGHLSLYDLTVEEGTPLAQRLSKPRAKFLQGDVHRREAERLLREAGYRQYEISNYARPGRRSVHNLGYWTMEPYVGIGPGAVSNIPAHWISDHEISGPFEIGDGTTYARGYSPEDIRAYTDGPDRGVRWEPVGRRDAVVDILLTGLRTTRGASIPLISRVAGFDPLPYLTPATRTWEKSRHLRVTATRIVPTVRGMRISDAIVRSLLDAVDAMPFAAAQQ